MRRLLHISDLHFGRINPELLTGLIRFVKEKPCDLAVISGDLTQRARASQFKQAQDFLKELSVKQFIIPGNHDIPLYNVFRRVLRPFSNYFKYISQDVEPTFEDEEIALVGLSTVSRWSVEGSFRTKSLEALKEKLDKVPTHLIKILVAHHQVPHDVLAKQSLEFDLCLAGHTHHASSTLREGIDKRRHIVIQAGTVFSTRLRGSPNSFNIIQIETNRISVQRFQWEPEAKTFYAKEEAVYSRASSGWVEA